MVNNKGKVIKKPLLKTHTRTLSIGVLKQSPVVLKKHNTTYLLYAEFSCVEGGSEVQCWSKLSCSTNEREAKCGTVHSVALERIV
jgi:hypothetical protein